MNRPASSALLAAAFLCALTWCTATPEASREYQKGTYPGAPPLRPGHGAPVVGQPGHIKPGLQAEPGPRHPALPHTPKTRSEPTIWASDTPEPKAAIEFDWNVPVPEDDEEAAAKLKMCAAIMKGKTERTLRQDEIQQFDRISSRWRACWPHAAVARCLDGLSAEANTEAERKVLQRAREFGDGALAEHCSGGAGMWSPGFTDTLNRVAGSR